MICTNHREPTTELGRVISCANTHSTREGMKHLLHHVDMCSIGWWVPHRYLPWPSFAYFTFLCLLWDVGRLKQFRLQNTIGNLVDYLLIENSDTLSNCWKDIGTNLTWSLTGYGEKRNFLVTIPSFSVADSSCTVTLPYCLGSALAEGQNLGND